MLSNAATVDINASLTWHSTTVHSVYKTCSEVPNGHHSLYMRRRLHTLVSPQSAPHHLATAPFTIKQFLCILKILQFTLNHRETTQRFKSFGRRINRVPGLLHITLPKRHKLHLDHCRWLIKFSLIIHRELKDNFKWFFFSSRKKWKVLSWTERRTILCRQVFTMTVSL